MNELNNNSFGLNFVFFIIKTFLFNGSFDLGAQSYIFIRERVKLNVEIEADR